MLVQIFFYFLVFIDVKELIRKILKEYTEPNPILVCEIVINDSLN
jgi:hypothetical protein